MTRSTPTLRSKAQLVLLTVFLTIAMSAVAAADAAGPTISSDKGDYAPGEVVTLSGTGWQAGESVHIVVNDSVGSTWSHSADVTADESGAITHILSLPGWFVATYNVTATGPISGTATSTFTDGAGITSVTLNGAAPPYSVAAGASITLAVGVNLTWGGYEDWRGTAWDWDFVNATCRNTPDHSAPWSGSESWQITAPQSAGIYDLEIWLYDMDGCWAPIGAGIASYTFSDALTVGPSKLAFTTPVRSGAVDECLGPITVQTRDAANGPANPLADTTVDLATEGPGAFYTTNACSTSTTSVSIPTSANSASFYYQASGLGDRTHTVTASATGLTQATQDEIIGSPTKLAFTTPAQSGAWGQCLGPITVQTQDAASGPANPLVNTTVNLATEGPGAFYTTNACSTSTTSVSIPTSENSASFYYKASGVGDGTHTATASATGLTQATQDETISAGPTKLVFTTPARSGAVGVCLGPITVQTQNAASGPANPLVNTTVNLATEGPGAFYTTNACSTSTTSASIPTSANSASFYYKASGVGDGTHTATASATGLTQATQNETISKVTLTVTASSPADQVYGDPVPTVTPGYAGFVPGDDAGDLDTAPTCGTTYTVGAGPGEYLTSCSGGVDANYAFSYVAGHFHVGKRTLTVIADDTAKAVGAPIPPLTFSYSGFVGGDDAGQFDIAPTCSTAATASSTVGVYPITCAGGLDDNYTFSFVAGELTVYAVPTCGDLPATIVGTGGADRLVGTSGADVIVGLGGDDVILGLGGDDLVCGGPGNDVLRGGGGNDHLYGQAGNDRLFGGPGNDWLIGVVGIDTAVFRNAIRGVSANLAVGTASGQGNDTLAGVENLVGSRFADTLVGDARANGLWGGAGDDTLQGLAGDDRLWGNAGADLLDGGTGHDTLDGGGGASTCLAGEVNTAC